jgi:hypothetical protein
MLGAAASLADHEVMVIPDAALETSRMPGRLVGAGVNVLSGGERGDALG